MDKKKVFFSKNSPCHRCNINQIELICYDCSPMNSFCRNCDSSTHSIPSKRHHKRDIVNFIFQNEQQSVKKQDDEIKTHKRTNTQNYNNNHLKKDYNSLPVDNNNNNNFYNRKNDNNEKRDYSPMDNKKILEYAKEKNRGIKIRNNDYSYSNKRKFNYESNNNDNDNIGNKTMTKLENENKNYYGDKLDFPVVYDNVNIINNNYNIENKQNNKDRHSKSPNENYNKERKYSKSSSNFYDGMKPSNFNSSIKSIDENLNFINHNASAITSNTNNLIGFQNGSTIPNFKDSISTSIITLNPLNNNNNDNNEKDNNENDNNNNNDNLIICYDHDNDKNEDRVMRKKISNKSIKKYQKGTFEKYEKLNTIYNNNNNNFSSIQSNGKNFTNTIQHDNNNNNKNSTIDVSTKGESSNNFYSKEYVNELKSQHNQEKEDLTYKINLLQTSLENIKFSLQDQILKVQTQIQDNNSTYEKKLKNLESQQKKLYEKNVILNEQDAEKEKIIENLYSQMYKLKQSNTELQEKYDYHLDACKNDKKIQQRQFDELQIKITQKENEIEDLRIYYDKKIEEILLNTSMKNQKKNEIENNNNNNNNIKNLNKKL